MKKGKHNIIEGNGIVVFGLSILIIPIIGLFVGELTGNLDILVYSLAISFVLGFVFLCLNSSGASQNENAKFNPNLTDATTEAIKHNTNYWTGERIAAEKNAAEYARVSAEYQKAIYDKLNKEGK